MKSLTLLAVAVMLLSSCSRLLVPMGNPPDKNPQPFVKLKSGSAIARGAISINKRTIKIDDKSVKKKEVAFYSDGKNTFGNIKGAAFAKQIYTGDINVYMTITTHTHTEYVGRSSGYRTGWKTSEHTHVRNYLQQTGTDKLNFFNYKSTKKFISPSDPGFKYLQTFKTHRMIDDFIMLGGFGTFCGGAVVAGNAVMSTSGKGTGAGLGMIFGGMGIIVAGAIMNQFNHLNLKRSVAAHNGLVVKD